MRCRRRSAPTCVDRDGLHEFLRFLAGARRDPNHSAEIIYGKTAGAARSRVDPLLRGDIGRRLISLGVHQAGLALAPAVPLASGRVHGADADRQHQYPGHARTSSATWWTCSGRARPRPIPWDYGLDPGTWIMFVDDQWPALFNLCSIVRLVYVVNVLGQNFFATCGWPVHRPDQRSGRGHFSRMRTGDLMARFTSDMARLADPLARTTAYSIYYIILLVLTFFGLIGLSWQLTLALLVIVPVYLHHRPRCSAPASSA